MALLPKLIEKDKFANAIGLTSILFHSTRILGPMLAALILAWADVTWVLVMSALLQLTAALLLFRVFIQFEPASGQQRSFGKEFLEGLAYVKQKQLLFVVLLLTLVNGFVVRPIVEIGRAHV